MIVFIYRDDYYNKENSPDKGLAEIIIGKHRGGPTGSCKLKFFGEYTRFDNLAHDSVGSFEVTVMPAAGRQPPPGAESQGTGRSRCQRGFHAVATKRSRAWAWRCTALDRFHRRQPGFVANRLPAPRQGARCPQAAGCRPGGRDEDPVRARCVVPAVRTLLAAGDPRPDRLAVRVAAEPAVPTGRHHLLGAVRLPARAVHAAARACSVAGRCPHEGSGAGRSGPVGRPGTGRSSSTAFGVAGAPAGSRCRRSECCGGEGFDEARGQERCRVTKEWKVGETVVQHRVCEDPPKKPAGKV